MGMGRVAQTFVFAKVVGGWRTKGLRVAESYCTIILIGNRFAHSPLPFLSSETLAVKTHPLDPIISEFATEEQAASYDRWFRTKVQASLDDPRPSVPHDEAMARIRATIDAAKQKQKRA